MANRWFTRNVTALEKAPVYLFMRATIGATGAITLDAANSKGVSAVVRNGTGDYTITLIDPYVRLFNVIPVFDQTGVGSTPTSASPIMSIKAQSVTTLSGGTIRVLFSAAAAGSGTDPDNGSVLLLSIVLSNSTAT